MAHQYPMQQQFPLTVRNVEKSEACDAQFPMLFSFQLLASRALRLTAARHVLDGLMVLQRLIAT